MANGLIQFSYVEQTKKTKKIKQTFSPSAILVLPRKITR